MTLATAATDLCKCGHDREAHEHFRAGSDCASCVDTSCSKFRRQWFTHRPAPLHAIGSGSRRNHNSDSHGVTHSEAA